MCPATKLIVIKIEIKGSPTTQFNSSVFSTDLCEGRGCGHPGQVPDKHPSWNTFVLRDVTLEDPVDGVSSLKNRIKQVFITKTVLSFFFFFKVLCTNLQQWGGQTSALCCQSDWQSMDQQHPAGPAAQTGPEWRRRSSENTTKKHVLIMCTCLNTVRIHTPISTELQLTRGEKAAWMLKRTFVYFPLILVTSSATKFPNCRAMHL